MRTYGRLLRRPSTALSLAAALLSAVPIGMWPLTVVLLAVGRGGSSADAGLLAAMFGVGNAVGIAIQGVLIVRMRDAVLLPAFALAGVAAAILLVADGPASLVARTGALLAGLAIPAVTPAVRGRFAIALPGDDRPGAYALVNVLFQAGIAAGPVLAAALATAGAVAVAPAVAAGFGLVAATALAVAHRRAMRPQARPATATREVATRSRAGVAALFGCAAAGGFGIGVLQVLVPIQAGATVAGAAFAALALAEVAGAVALGAWVRSRHAIALLVAGTTAMAAVYLVLAVGVLPVVALLALLGVATSTQSLGSALALDGFVAAARLPVAYAAQIAILVTASAVGAFVAGTAPGTAVPLVAVLLTVAAGGAITVAVATRRLPIPAR